MKIIVAGFSKTGTKSMNSVLTELGYNVYDFIDHFWYHEKYWAKIFKDGGSIDDFKEMYEDVDAVVDAPAFSFWEEISEAFPEAKIILTIREENSWAKALVKQTNSSVSISMFKGLFYHLCPTSRRNLRHTELYTPLCYGSRISTLTLKQTTTTRTLKKRYRQHNANVMQNAPKDKLLVFNVKDGWEPLCKFLGKDIPEKPFPWLNKNGDAIAPMMKKHAYGKQMKKEVLFVSCCLVALFGMLCYFLIHLF